MVLRWLDHFYTQVFHPVELLINVLIIMAIKGYAQTTINGTTIVILTKTNITVTTVINTALTCFAFLDLMQFQSDFIDIKIMGGFDILYRKKDNTAFYGHILPFNGSHDPV